jgi:uncharacterized protein YeaO (DUF488 family)
LFRIKRIYEPLEADDGYRVLVDRLWPRGLSKEAAAVDEWLKEVAPSHDLRKWFNHEAARWAEFGERYEAELQSPERAAALDRLREVGRERGTVTLLYAPREETRNHARLLLERLARA